MDKPLKQWLLAQAAYYLEYLQPKKAIALLEAVRKLDPNEPDVHRMLSYAYLKANRPEESIKSADSFMQCVKPGTDTRAIKWIKGRALLKKKKSAAL
ncbi:tetratricopeptide repeat protein [Endozoicomonas sp. Mp262]|uniref:tetratricopeptide repeat protein n=1 Tax=Endozoicomonas sp. Mp262 TaxID=2919499 RepID=UPI0021E094D3